MVASENPVPDAQAESALRAATLNATARLLATEGFRGVTVRRIAAAAGCSTMAVYHYFESKQGVIEAVYAEGHSRLHVAQDAHRFTDDPRSDVRNTCLVYRDVALSFPDYYVVMFGRPFGDLVGAEAARTIARTNFGAFVEVVRRWDEEAPLAVPPEVAAYTLWAAGHGMVMLELTAQGLQADRGEHYAALTDALMRGLVR